MAAVDPRNYGDYFDIMVIGNTGAGKTTTADKLLLANPTNKEYGYVPTPTPTEGGDAASSQDMANSFVSTNNNDLTMWKTSSEQDFKHMEKRLKDLVFLRDTSTYPHEEINKRRIHSKASTVCEVISNDTSKVRVLDVPGFFSSSNQAAPADALRHMESVTSSNLATMRTILHIKIALQFKFNRIVYFLPEKGVLRRDSEILKSNIKLMENYFGKSIFAPMVVVATHDQSVYDIVDPGKDLYPPQYMDTTRKYFQLAMASVFPEATPTPPIIFLSFLSSCEKVLSLFKTTVVHGAGVELTFNNSVCIRCNINVHRVTSRMSQRDQNSPNQDQNEDTICKYPNTDLAVQYYDSTCHPMLIPKHSRLRKIAGGFVRIITFGRADKEKWPWFWCCDEKCIGCSGPPGTRGCMKVGTRFDCDGGSIRVDHSHDIRENFVVDNN